MKAVFKHKIVIGSSLEVKTTLEAKVVLVAEQFPGEVLTSHQLTIWIENIVPATVVRHFEVFGTGQKIPDFYIHVGSVAVEQGGLIWHLYESASYKI